METAHSCESAQRVKLRHSPLPTQPTEMLPGSLNPEILVHILSYLDNGSLHALLLTSKELYPYAAKTLYSQPWTPNLTNKIQRSLLLNPENGKYLSEYRCTSIPDFARVLSKGPLHLHRLYLDFKKRQLRIREKIEFADDCALMIKRIHADTTIREVDLSCINPVLLCREGRPHEVDGEQDRGGAFLSKLSSFKGIERVILRPFESTSFMGGRSECYNTSQEVLDELSPLSTLKHITFIDAEIQPEDWQLTFPDGALPNLKSIQFHYTIPEDPSEITKDELEFLKPYQKRGIFFEVTAYSYSKPYMMFYLPAMKHLSTDKDRRSLIRWLVRGEQFFQLHEHALEIFMLDLISYKVPERNLILNTIKPVEFEKPFALRLAVYEEDSNMTSPSPDMDSNAKLFADILPPQLSYLELFVRGSLEVGFIASLIPTLKHLDRLVLGTFTKVPKTVWKKIDSGSSTVILYGQGNFTREPYSIKILSPDVTRAVIWSLELDREEDPLWNFLVRKEDGGDEEGVVDEETKEYVTGENGAVEKEMSEWFGLSESLRTINLRVFAGRAWLYEPWRPYFEYDSIVE